MPDRIEQEMVNAREAANEGDLKLRKHPDWKLGAPRKIKDQLGAYYICVLNVKEQRRFNGFPDQDATEIILLDDNIRKNAEMQVDGYEMVYEVIKAPESDLVLSEGQNNFERVNTIANVGDIVILKGNVFKIHTEPVVFAATRENFVAVIKTAEERTDFAIND